MRLAAQLFAGEICYFWADLLFQQSQAPVRRVKGHHKQSKFHSSLLNEMLFLSKVQLRHWEPQALRVKASYMSATTPAVIWSWPGAAQLLLIAILASSRLPPYNGLPP